MTYLKLTLYKNNSYKKQIIKLNSIKINNDNNSDSYKIEKIIVKRKIYFKQKR